MSFRSDVVEVGSDAAQSHGQTDTSSHDHSLARRSNNCPTNTWLQESFLQTVNNAERIAAGGPRPGVGIFGIGLLDTHINRTPTMHSACDALPAFDHASAPTAPRYLGWRQKVATWPAASPPKRINDRKLSV
ncbi:hypothetical protein GCG54_00005949 [Colletotrichum gloeosporioides]|uniref:Uncharacterized protein n=1 Tax=Colletotrichum gloeosporioides TaxID=474922 RepID=A0A8H4CLJ3_COLGL|nr:uncharacterized protein GCG54_00005949 [Colletotrichum gloeosporioides]KAF3806188.1 hypothetical protein GCG54_00005949 [Colletotrichum gloeosporioides]